MRERINYLISKVRELLLNTDLDNRQIIELLLMLVCKQYLLDIVYKVGNKSSQLFIASDGGLKTSILEEESICATKSAFRSWEIIKEIIQVGNNIYKKISSSKKDALENILYEFFNKADKPLSWKSECVNSFFDEIVKFGPDINAKAQENFSPPELGEIISNLIDLKNPESLEDPYCKSGELLSMVATHFSSLRKIQGSIDNFFLKRVVGLRLFMLDIDNYKEVSIYQDIRQKYSKGNKSDIIITNGSFNSKTDKAFISYSIDDNWSNQFSNNHSENDYICYFLDHLSDEGQGAIVVPTSALSGTSKIRVQLKKAFVTQNLLEAVIILPQHFLRPGIKASLLFFNKMKKHQSTLMVDMTKAGEKTANRNELTTEEIDELKTYVHQYRTNGNVVVVDNTIDVKVVTKEQIEEQNFDLKFNQYKQEFEVEERKHSDVLWQECLYLEEELKQIQQRLLYISSNNKFKSRVMQ